MGKKRGNVAVVFNAWEPLMRGGGFKGTTYS